MQRRLLNLLKNAATNSEYANLMEIQLKLQQSNTTRIVQQLSPQVEET